MKPRRRICQTLALSLYDNKALQYLFRCFSGNT